VRGPPVAAQDTSPAVYAACFHLHLVNHRSAHWEKHLLFRDYLRAHPDKARAYYALKRRLASKHGPDRAGYTDAKTTFIDAVVADARPRSP
jgi:GrpB-like predicted nucleotidyltransferase (UPF0157 family)